MFRSLSEKVLVSPQIQPQDVAAAAALGVTVIVNNRPDDEEPGQPTGAEIRAAAISAGLDYVHIPIARGYSGQEILAMGEAVACAKGRVLAFSKCGYNSAALWGMARGRQGVDKRALIAAAADAGYDITNYVEYVLLFSEKAGDTGNMQV